MKIIIVKQTDKLSRDYYAYRTGLLSRLGIFCDINKIYLFGSSTVEGCIELARHALLPKPPKNSKVIKTVEI